MEENLIQQEAESPQSLEDSLKEQNRKLFIANDKLAKTEEQLNAALLENSILNGINRYGIHKQKLKDFLPELIRDMLKLSEMPFGIFDHISFHSTSNNYRSDMIVNNTLPFTRCLPETLQDRVVDNLMDFVSEMVLEQKHYIKLENLAESVDERGKEMVATFNVDMIVGLPIISHDRVAGVIYLFNSHLSDKQARIIEHYQDALKQLGYLIEHRYQEEILSKNYQDLKDANSALEEAKNQLVQSEKMASLGQLSAGIAHEINNPMGFLKSNVFTFNNYIESLKQYINATISLKGQAAQLDHPEIQASVSQLDDLSEAIDLDFLLDDSDELLEESKQGIERVINIVSGLKRFARQSDNRREICEINNILDEALKLAHNELKYSVEVETDYQAVGSISANSGELVQVFLNMFINAKQAMEEQGKIIVRLKPADKGVEVTVTDNGSGMDKSVVDQIFNPFFTTKDVGVGTGLGLSISYGIINDHGGRISVESVVGEGTTFHIWLPVAQL